MVVALLETALSAAASVIFSRLLMSGDVEQNPGPGIYRTVLGIKNAIILVSIPSTDLDYDSIDSEQILGELDNVQGYVSNSDPLY